MRTKLLFAFFIFLLFYSVNMAFANSPIKNVLFKADSLFLCFKNTDAISFLKKTFSLYKLNSSEKAEINYALGCNYFEMQNYDSADFYFDNALKLADDGSLGLKINIVIKKNNIPKNILQLDKSYKMLYELYQSPSFGNIDKLTKANLYYYWLSNSWGLKDINESKRYFNLMTKTIDSINVKSLKRPLEKLHLFEHYTKLGTYTIITYKNADSALKYLQKADAIFNSTIPYYNKLYNIAKGHFYLQNIPPEVNTSKYWFKKNIALLSPDYIDYSGAEFMLGKLYYLQDSVTLSINHFKRAESCIKNLQQPSPYTYQVIKWLAEAYAKKGDSLSAARYFILSSHMGEKLNEKNNISTLNTFKFLRDTDLYNFEKKELEQKHKSANRNLIFIIACITVILLIVGIGFFTYRRLNSNLKGQKKRLERALLNNSFLTKEMHHRVKNNLNMISSLLNLQSKQINNEEAKLILTESKNRIKSVAILHQGLYQNMDDLSGKIVLNDYVQRLSSHTSHIYKNENKNIQYHISIPDNIILGLDAAIPLGLILNEFITNSMKYAFETVSNCNIIINATYDNNTLTIVYEDNGAGFDKNKVKNSFGFSLIELLCGQLNAKLELDSTNKTRYTLILKID